ncbi:MAG: phosphoribosylaminoimidazolesuccinocarboxamide synthase [Flavobacteriales bacterium]
MLTNKIVAANSLLGMSFKFPGQIGYYKGKVRDVYSINDTHLLMVASDRISAFDVVMPRGIPFKGQVLNQVAAHFLRATAHEVPNWLIDVPDPNVAIGYKCEPLKVEMVVRGYLAGHAWREYKAGKRMLCGVTLPEGLKENDRLPHPIITPSTKADEGHDEDISREQIIAQGIVAEQDYQVMEAYSLKLFEIGTKMAAERGLILVDTKYEFGKYNDQVLLIDEVHTPDSSRYFYLDGYEERQVRGEAQKQLSKEFVRQWLIDHDFMGKPGQLVPVMDDDFVVSVSKRYVEIYELLTGQSFQYQDYTNAESRIEENIKQALSRLSII